MATNKYLDDNGLAYLWGKIKSALSGKVDKVDGKGLSTNDFTATEKNKLSGIQTGAEVNVQSDWNTTDTSSDSFIKNKPTNVSAFSNDAGYQTSTDVSTAIANKANKSTTLAGYGITNAYTKDETDSAIATAVGDITGVEFKIVSTLPTSGESGVIYLISNGGKNPNSYDEYIWLSDGSKFEKIGTTDIDLSGYWSKAELVAITNAEIDTVVAA